MYAELGICDISITEQHLELLLDCSLDTTERVFVTYLFHLGCTVASGPKEHHSQGGQETQRRKKDVLNRVVIAHLFEDLKAELCVCCTE